MKCRKARKLILSYAELDPSLKKRLDEHISSCPQCAREFSLNQESISLLKQYASFEESRGFWEGYQVDLRRKIDSPPLWSRARRRIEEIAGLIRTPVFGAVPVYVFSVVLIALLTLGFLAPLTGARNVARFENNLVPNRAEVRGAFDDGEHTIYVVSVEG